MAVTIREGCGEQERGLQSLGKERDKGQADAERIPLQALYRIELIEGSTNLATWHRTWQATSATLPVTTHSILWHDLGIVLTCNRDESLYHRPPGSQQHPVAQQCED